MAGANFQLPTSSKYHTQHPPAPPSRTIWAQQQQQAAAASNGYESSYPPLNPAGGPPSTGSSVHDHISPLSGGGSSNSPPIVRGAHFGPTRGAANGLDGTGPRPQSGHDSAVVARPKGTAPPPSAKRTFTNGDDDGKERKRSRQALSCSECKRRKIKCDRKTPCEACLKRGTPEACTWEDVKTDPAPQPFALVQDLSALARRLQMVEAFLQTLPPDLRVGAPKPIEFQLSAPPAIPRPTEVSRAALIAAAEDDDLAARDMEDAAVALEGATFATVQHPEHPSAYRIPTYPLCANPVTNSPVRGPAREPELTRYLTSIIDEGITNVFCDARAPLAAAQMGLDVDCTAETLPHLRRAAIARACSVMPSSRAVSTMIVNKYLDEINWMHNIIHRESFEAEHDYYWKMVEEGRRDEVCPIWLAVYAVILALAHDVELPAFNSATRARLPTDVGQAIKLQAAAQRLLDLGDWRARPQFRSAQVILLLDQFQQAGGGDGYAASRFLVNVASAIRVLQVLGYHKLGADDETMPPDDPAFPPGKNSLKRQWALRIWNKFVFLDAMFASGKLRAYMITESQTTTAAVSNVDLIDLSTTEWRLNPRPHSVFTDSSFDYFKWKGGVHSRKAFDLLRSPNFTYDTILELDAEFREFLASIPAEDPVKEATRPHLRWKRLLTTEATHSRICRMHRPFLTRGYAPGSRFAASREKCLQSAIYVLEHSGPILEVNINLWFVYSHNLAAIIVCFADLFHAIDHDASADEVEEKKAILLKAQETFSRYPQIRMPLRNIVERGSRILSGLFLAEEKRRATRAALTLVGSAPSSPPESFADVLQRISREIAASPCPFAPRGEAAAEPVAHQLTLADISRTDDALTDQFFRDLGFPTGVSVGDGVDWDLGMSNLFDILTQGNAGSGMAFLGGGGLETSMASNAVLDQMSGPWQEFSRAV